MIRRVTAPSMVGAFHSPTPQSDAWDRPRVSHSTLSFLDKAALAQAG